MSGIEIALLILFGTLGFSKYRLNIEDDALESRCAF